MAMALLFPFVCHVVSSTEAKIDTTLTSAWDDTIEIDAGSITAGSDTVGKGVFQLETGFIFTHETRNRATGEILNWATALRGGITENIELRFETAGLTQERDVKTGTKTFGMSDPYFGVKWHGWDGDDGLKPSVGLIAFSSIPVGSPSVSSGKVEFGLTGAFDWVLTKKTGLTINISAIRSVDSLAIKPKSFWQENTSFEVSHALTHRVSLAAGMNVLLPYDSHGHAGIDADIGAGYLVTKDIIIESVISRSILPTDGGYSATIGFGIRWGGN